MEQEKIIQAGKIATQVKEYAKSFIKKDMLLLEIAKKIESKIEKLGGKSAFPTNLSINEIAAHYTPTFDDETKAHGLLKIDLGVHIDGWVADTAFSVDLENSEKNKKLIYAAEAALKNAIDLIQKEKTTLGEIGKTIQETIEAEGFSPILNLSGHSMEQYDLHAGITIPNINTQNQTELTDGLYAIEPFSTTGSGKVQDGRPSGIYQIIDDKNTRSPIAREILSYITEEHGSLPFCERWLIKKFGTKAKIALHQLESQGILHQYPQLIEISKEKVAQAENTILITKDKKIVTSE
ncbi:type II methionyl aminopeptidase [archaeon]|jgi:methionyl aminopeptidase|nr:type II methionyl aminopeptidase [archaeon]MBT4373673.1 type II methionyl aminopeptidase [archaeon]MBT4531727.1 type II methionyl aminopeptidase [archaeon]MBT7001839.1 type II methionyl aminopeptidase [archaeon]MBT7281824.1 type II methionyl aminopeptidase [archaeon]